MGSKSPRPIKDIKLYGKITEVLFHLYGSRTLLWELLSSLEPIYPITTVPWVNVAKQKNKYRKQRIVRSLDQGLCINERVRLFLVFLNATAIFSDIRQARRKLWNIGGVNDFCSMLHLQSRNVGGAKRCYSTPTPYGPGRSSQFQISHSQL